MKLIESHSIWGRIAAFTASITLVLSLGWTAEHCATFEEGARLLEDSMQHQMHGEHHAHHGHQGHMGEQEPSSPVEQEERTPEECHYCQVPTGKELAFFKLPSLEQKEIQLQISQEMEIWVSELSSSYSGRGPPSV